MVIRTVFLTGPRIDIEFKSADGVEAGKTEVRYKEVVIGKVVSVAPARRPPGRRRHRPARPIGDALCGRGHHVLGRPAAHRHRRHHRARNAALGRLHRHRRGRLDQVAQRVRRPRGAALRAARRAGLGVRAARGDLGSLDVGSPVFHRRTPVGRVVGYTLDPDRDELSLKVFIEAPYQKLVTTDTRFWNASGIDLTLNASGLSVNTQTLASVLAGGLAFESPPGAARGRAGAGEHGLHAVRRSPRRARAARRRRGADPDGVRSVGARPGARRGDRPARRRDRPRAQRRAAVRRAEEALPDRSPGRHLSAPPRPGARRACCAMPAAPATRWCCSGWSRAACARSCERATCSPASSTWRSISSPGRRAPRRSTATAASRCRRRRAR